MKRKCESGMRELAMRSLVVAVLSVAVLLAGVTTGISDIVDIDAFCATSKYTGEMDERQALRVVTIVMPKIISADGGTLKRFSASASGIRFETQPKWKSKDSGDEFAGGWHMVSPKIHRRNIPGFRKRWLAITLYGTDKRGRQELKNYYVKDPIAGYDVPDIALAFLVMRRAAEKRQELAGKVRLDRKLGGSIDERLEQLKKLHEKGLISTAVYETRQQEILSGL